MPKQQTEYPAKNQLNDPASSVYTIGIRWFAILALLFWLVALFLPAIHTNPSFLGNNPPRVINGFECIWYATLASLLAPYPFLLLAIPNYCLLLSCIVIGSNPTRKRPILATATLISIPSALVTLTLNDPLHIGFFCWLASLLLIAISALMTLWHGETAAETTSPQKTVSEPATDPCPV